MNILASLENNQSFYLFADFFAYFTTLSFTSRGKIQRFIATDQSKIISLQDSVAVYELPPLRESICFYHRVSPCSFSRCWTAKLDEENNQHRPKKRAQKTALELAVFSLSLN